jgi:hypothetical protein
MALAIRLEMLNDFSTELRAWLQFTVKQESEQERRQSMGKEGREPHERKGGESSETHKGIHELRYYLCYPRRFCLSFRFRARGIERNVATIASSMRVTARATPTISVSVVYQPSSSRS